MSCCSSCRKKSGASQLDEFRGIPEASAGARCAELGFRSSTTPVERELESGLDTPRAVRLNRCMREWLGWMAYRFDLYRLVGFSRTCPTEDAFAHAVRRWQQKSRLTVDGIVGLSTLNAMHRALGRGPLATEPDRPAWVKWDPSPNHSSRDGKGIDRIIYHATAGRALGPAINGFRSRKKGTSAHFLVARDGQVIQMVDLSESAHHAGRYYNARSVGIEIVNTGPLYNKGKKVKMCSLQEKRGNRWVCAKWTEVQPVHAREDYYRHSPYWDRNEWWVPYSEAQYRSLIRLTRFLVSCIPTIRYITGHEHLLSWKNGRFKNRNDPGGAFDWGRIREALEGWFNGYLCHRYSRKNRKGVVDASWETSCPGFRP